VVAFTDEDTTAYVALQWRHAPALVQKFASEAIALVNLPETLWRFAATGIEPAGESSDGFAKALTAEAAHVAKVIEAADIKVQ
jgi:hypothetical protein